MPELVVFAIGGSLYGSLLIWLATGQRPKRVLFGLVITMPVIAALAAQRQLPPASNDVGDYAGLAAVSVGLLVAVSAYRLLARSTET